jgi:2-amino-4-hydroxy-6-hydroxymethyldihydropteridine diphosphokinase
VSALYATAPQGVVDQPEFLNCVAKAETDLSAQAALLRCQAVETANGRERTVHWGPRTLDIDILFYDDIRSTDPALVLPHPRLWERAFVLAPLLELWPDLVAPDGETGQRLLGRLLHDQRVRLLSAANWAPAGVPTTGSASPHAGQ